jgi:tRNA A-37 threonylcarbamoyl transferase component Bud32
MGYRELPPPGFVRFAIDTTEVVCAKHIADSVLDALRAGTLYRYAENHPEARALSGRAIAYAVPLPGDVERVVIRHNRHGGLLAPVTRDLFRAPTAAPAELKISEKLRRAGVPTPIMLGYAIYAASSGLRRADVITRMVENSHDLSAALMSNDRSYRERALAAAAALVTSLSEANARHHDLNVKNVLLRDTANSPEAMVLDVDRVEFVDDTVTARDANVARFLRSAKKWQSVHEALVTDAELDAFAAAVRSRPRLASTLS